MVSKLFFSKQLSFVFPNEFLAFSAAKAISIGSNKPHEKRSFVEIISNKNVVLLKISAKDKHALNASRYFYERLFNLCQSLALEVF